MGPPLYKGFQDIAGMEHEEALKAAAIYRSKYSVTGLFENKPYDGIEEVLKTLKEHGKVIIACNFQARRICHKDFKTF